MNVSYDIARENDRMLEEMEKDDMFPMEEAQKNSTMLLKPLQSSFSQSLLPGRGLRNRTPSNISGSRKTSRFHSPMNFVDASPAKTELS